MDRLEPFEMRGVIEAQQAGFGLERQLAHGAVFHYAPPLAVIAVQQLGQSHTQRSAVGHHDDSLPGMSLADAA